MSSKRRCREDRCTPNPFREDVDIFVPMNIHRFNEQKDCCDCDERKRCNRNKKQTHVHEVAGSVRLAELGEDPHNHRFSGVTDEVIIVPEGHIHRFQTKTDFYEDHFHPIYVKTGLQVMVGEGDDARHTHFIDANTAVVDGHFHKFIVDTLIENPIGD